MKAGKSRRNCVAEEKGGAGKKLKRRKQSAGHPSSGTVEVEEEDMARQDPIYSRAAVPQAIPVVWKEVKGI